MQILGLTNDGSGNLWIWGSMCWASVTGDCKSAMLLFGLGTQCTKPGGYSGGNAQISKKCSRVEVFLNLHYFFLIFIPFFLIASSSMCTSPFSLHNILLSFFFHCSQFSLDRGRAVGMTDFFFLGIHTQILADPKYVWLFLALICYFFVDLLINHEIWIPNFNRFRHL